MLNKLINTLLVIGIAFIWGLLLNANFVFPAKSTEKDLQPYVTEYYSLLEARCPTKKKGIFPRGNYKIKFGDGEAEGWIGLCEYMQNGYVVTIDKAWWDNESTSGSRDHLMNHELSHCVIGKMHEDSPYHYMYFQLTYVSPERIQSQLKVDMETYCNE